MSFEATIAVAHAVDGPAIDLGRGVREGTPARGAVVQPPLAMPNRHGLTAGATGRTKTLQVIAAQLSSHDVPVLVADVKGDVSGLLAPGDPAGGAGERAADLGIPYAPTGFPVELLSLGGLGPGVPVRFPDSDAGKPEDVLLRALVALETGGGTAFFGEPQLDGADLLRTAPDGRGVVFCVELAPVQELPALWSTALVWLAAEPFESLSEAGDLAKPKLVVLLDEAHLLFDEATEAFLDAIERTVRLIRSRGVGVFLVTQTPRDLPAAVLAQLGNKRL